MLFCTSFAEDCDSMKRIARRCTLYSLSSFINWYIISNQIAQFLWGCVTASYLLIIFSNFYFLFYEIEDLEFVEIIPAVSILSLVVLGTPCITTLRLQYCRMNDKIIIFTANWMNILNKSDWMQTKAIYKHKWIVLEEVGFNIGSYVEHFQK